MNKSLFIMMCVKPVPRDLKERDAAPGKRESRLVKGGHSMNEKNMDLGRFGSFDLGATKPTARAFDRIEVRIEPNSLLGNFATAFINEAERKNPLTFDRVGLTASEVERYIYYLMTKRAQSIEGNSNEFRKLKVLWIPAYVQYCLRLVGKVTIYEEGLELLPIMEEESDLTFEEALLISDKIGAFHSDLQLVQDGMPRDPMGNVDVMSTALIAGYICARKEVHVAATYVCAFMGLKLQQEAAFQVLYRLRYDDLDYIASVLTTQKVV